MKLFSGKLLESTRRDLGFNTSTLRTFDQMMNNDWDDEGDMVFELHFHKAQRLS
jgi:hypothetical protein